MDDNYKFCHVIGCGRFAVADIGVQATLSGHVATKAYMVLIRVCDKHISEFRRAVLGDDADK